MGRIYKIKHDEVKAIPDGFRVWTKIKTRLMKVRWEQK